MANTEIHIDHIDIDSEVLAVETKLVSLISGREVDPEEAMKLATKKLEDVATICSVTPGRSPKIQAKMLAAIPGR